MPVPDSTTQSTLVPISKTVSGAGTHTHAGTIFRLPLLKAFLEYIPVDLVRLHAKIDQGPRIVFPDLRH